MSATSSKTKLLYQDRPVVFGRDFAWTRIRATLRDFAWTRIRATLRDFAWTRIRATLRAGTPGTITIWFPATFQSITQD